MAARVRTSGRHRHDHRGRRSAHRRLPACAAPRTVLAGTPRAALMAAALAVAAALAAGCAHLGVEPWERDLLSERSMQVGADRIDIVIDDHIYFSKEAASGGRGVGGGGCGCN